ncbi:Beta-1,2-xylosyltransferase 1 [Cyphellophora attinorum]|uniref:Beta-1,2-xylosyltransferase 1 n=1 Tax=Cyphellophora attinorum TaxID=1664694 RepID=A0A0N1H882_9EURO|nr:Beta-1,2-xylosyltransferase 1 [Phialophora attinorum]KPI38062.1 Beta-1,2-xylosyltransferase 1 [Phialophora attinorum]
MGPIELNKRRIFLLAAAIFTFTILFTGLPPSNTVRQGVDSIPGIPHSPPSYSGIDPDEAWDYPDPEPKPVKPPANPYKPPKRPEYHDEPEYYTKTTSSKSAPVPTETLLEDEHPITKLMQQADLDFRLYEGGSSQTFRQTIEKYRSKYGRHPPPGFKEWYKFARKRNVVNIDDFEHIMDDLRPFWTVKPSDIRTYAAHMWEVDGDGLAGIHIRDHKVAKVNAGSWRSETFQQMVETFIEHIPDMDIAMNRLDQPRVVVPYEDLQKMLSEEEASRVMHPEAMDSFTESQSALLDISINDPKLDNSTRLDAGWFGHAGRQYMEVASKACPPDSPARRNYSAAEADALYKEPTAGIVTNFNLSSDLCTVGPTIKDLHGLLFSASSMSPSHKLVPVFGECKVNINNDIMFPANMYYRHDSRYDYDASGDVDWRDKTDTLIWRGVTSGGVQVEDNWNRMHRQRLVQLSNGTWTTLNQKTFPVLTTNKDSSSTSHSSKDIAYKPVSDFDASAFAEEHNDVGFVESWGCVPNCDFYHDVFSWKNQTTLTSQFAARYLIDVDGHSFSGRWHAFLQSKSLGLKATIFREWHDSRLFQWRHFVPLDNRYEELYAVMMYFIGYDSKASSKHETHSIRDITHAEAKDTLDSGAEMNGVRPAASTSTSAFTSTNPDIYIPAHPRAAQKIARQSREWANRVLRREDIEVYMFRLLLEYARICDDNRDRIGYSGDGSDMDDFDNGVSAKYGWGVKLPGLSGLGEGKWPWSAKQEEVEEGRKYEGGEAD